MIEPTPQAQAYARAFLLEKWRERAAELGRPQPADLSGACKFASLFALAIFGGYLQGNAHHQYVVRNDEIVDLTAESSDVLELPNPYTHNPSFWLNPDHRESLESCYPRVYTWVREYQQRNTT